MSKINLPTCNLDDSLCDKLFQSITDKLHIQNPKFYYPIYNKIIDNASSHRGLIFDSKFKVKEVLSKIMDSESEEWETDNEDEKQVSIKPSFNLESIESKHSTINQSSSNIFDDCEKLDNLDNIDNLDEIFNNKKEIEIDKLENNEDADDEDDEDDDDIEIQNAINNFITATAVIERDNKETGEKTVKEDKIHIKKTPLLEPLKILKDEFIIPARLKNKNISNETIHNTNMKLESYNNYAHVEALFLYLGNKLVESGKCPSFPYYYGCINGEDPNYHHDITDECETVSRTRWFRQRIKNDFDLLILEGDEMDDTQKEIINNMYKPNSFKQHFDNESETSYSTSDDDSFNTTKYDINNMNIHSGGHNIIENTSANNSESESDIEKALDFLDNCDKQVMDDDIDHTLESILENEKIKEQEHKLDTDLVNNKMHFMTSIHTLDDDNEDLKLDDIIETQIIENTECRKINNNIDIDDLIEVLSDVDKDALTLSDFEDNSMNNQYYLKCADIPVSLCMMEKLDQTLDNILDDGYNMSETEWFSVFFQTAFGLAVAQKYFNFVHNDLHSSNIMFKSTTLKNLYFQIGNQIYKVPTFGKITKIIDFARGTFKLGDRWIFSDQFKEDGEAWGQYDYPTDGTLKNCEHKPNPSFDLVRLGTTVIQRLDDVPNVRQFVESITRDDYDNSLCYEEDTFQLYIDIAHNAHNAVPIEVLARPDFHCFQVSADQVPKGVYIFKY